MPVYHAPAGRVFARTAELDRWRRERPNRLWLRWLMPGATALGIVVIAAAVFLLMHSDAAGVPASVRFERQTVVVVDQSGRTRWTTSIPNLGFSNEWGWEVSTPSRFLVSDVDQDGEVEVLINILSDSRTDKPGRLVCYSQDGRVRWEFAFGRRFKDSYGEYAQDYNGHVIRAVRIGSRPYVLSIAAHRLWHPCQVALLDPSTGEIVEQFWHPGAITHALVADLDHDGAEELVLAGVNNPGPGPGSPVVMELRLPFSLARPTPGSVFAEMSDGGPIAYVVMPRPDVLAAQGGIAAVLNLVFEEPATLVVQARYTRDKNTNRTYRFDPGLRLRGFFAPIDLAAVHDTLWRAGALNHEFSDQELAELQDMRWLSQVPDGNAIPAPPLKSAR